MTNDHESEFDKVCWMSL